MASKSDEIREKVNKAMSDGDPHKDIFLSILDEIEKIYNIIPEEAWHQAGRPQEAEKSTE